MREIFHYVTFYVSIRALTRRATRSQNMLASSRERFNSCPHAEGNRVHGG